MDIYSPDDCFIKSISVKSGRVNSEQQLMVLYSPMASFMQSLAKLISTQLDIVERPYLDGRVAKEGQVIANAQANAQTKQQVSDVDLAWTEGNNVLGTEPQTDVLQKQIADLTAKTDLGKATYSNSVFSANNSDSHDRITAAKKFMAVQSGVIEDFLTRLTIKSPDNGQFTALVAEGCFVKKGDKIGELR